MGIIISDGTGSGRSTTVNPDNRLSTEALTLHPLEFYSHHGRAYWIASDFISLTTTASYSALLYLKNTDTKYRFHIEYIRTSSTVGTLWRIIKNPTTGTLISGGSAITPVNGLFESSKIAVATALKGADASTMTNGTFASQHQTGAHNSFESMMRGGLILSNNTAIGIEAKPSASGVVGATIVGWYELPED